jgi:drug/metabolite transporter (DMT)-like permease
MKNAPAARVATYAYVNPVVAVLLGWIMLGEALTGQMLIGAVVIVGSVVLITSPSKKVS